MPEDTRDERSYLDFYEELGKKYPESELVHDKAKRDYRSRFWTVIRELRPFAERHASLLDLGCNDGVYSIPYAKMGGTVLGVDLSVSLVEKATKRAEEMELSTRCHFTRGNVETFHPKEAFDIVLFSEVLEHVLHPDDAIRNIAALSVKGGKLLLTTPTPLFEGLARLGPSYLSALITGRRLVDEQRIDSGQNPVARYGIRARHYRHDAYYPRALIRYIESLGFNCYKFYTIGIPLRARLIMPEMSARRFPLINLLGKTNVGLFIKR